MLGCFIGDHGTERPTESYSAPKRDRRLTRVGTERPAITEQKGFHPHGDQSRPVLGDAIIWIITNARRILIHLATRPSRHVDVSTGDTAPTSALRGRESNMHSRDPSNCDNNPPEGTEGFLRGIGDSTVSRRPQNRNPSTGRAYGVLSVRDQSRTYGLWNRR